MHFRKISSITSRIWRQPTDQVSVKADSWSPGHMRWLEMSEPSGVNLKYNGLHTCSASACVTVYSGVWVRGAEYSDLPSFLQEKELDPHLRQLKRLLSPLATYLYPPFIKFISQRLFHSSLCQFASFPICSLQGGKRYSSRWKQRLSVWCPFSWYLSFQLSDYSIFTALSPQTNNPTVKAVGLPSQACCLRLALLRMRGWGCFDMRALSLPLLMSPKQKRSWATYMAGCHFSFRESGQILKLLQQ